MFEFHCINSTAYDNRNSPTTGKYWLIKAFEVLKGIQDDVVLDGTVYLDETYFTKVRSKLVTKDGKKLRGISRNKIGVGVVCNETNSIFIFTGTSKPSRKSTKETYSQHIARGSVLIHDDEHSHSILIEELELKSIVYPTKETKGLSDGYSQNKKDFRKNLVNLNYYSIMFNLSKQIIWIDKSKR